MNLMAGHQEYGSWIWKENLLPFCELTSEIAAYSFDSSDADAILEGLKGTEEGIFFEYPLPGTSPITLSFSDDRDSSIVSIRAVYPQSVEGEIRQLFYICASYFLTRGTHV